MNSLETKVYIASTAPLKDEALFLTLYKQIPQWRREKVDFYRFKKDKFLSLTAALLLSFALKNAGIEENKLIVAYTPEGKPYFQNRLDIFFSLSHSGERAMCAISSNPIGCDVERKTDSPDIDLVKWTKMESYAKAAYKDLSGLLDGSISFSPDFVFRHITRDDDYIYTLCSREPIPDSQIIFDPPIWKKNPA